MLGGAVFLPLLAGALASPIAMAQSPSPEIGSIPIPGGPSHMRLSPDGTTVAVYEDPVLLAYQVDPDRLPIRLIDLASGQPTRELAAFDDYAADVAFSPDGSQLVSKHLNGELLVWDLVGPTDEPVTSIQTPSLGVGRIAFLPDGETLALLMAGTPSWIELIDLDAGSVTSVFGPAPETYAGLLEQTRPGPAYDLQLATMDVSPDGLHIATSTPNDEVAVWSIDSGEPQTLRPPSERPGGINIRQLLFSGNDSLMYFDQSDGRTYAWDVTAGTEAGSLGLGGTPFALSPTTAQLAWAEARDEQVAVGIADLYGSIAPFDLAVIDGRLAPGISSIAYTYDGSTIVLGGLVAPEGENAIHLVAAPW
jgi:hypothetical protein